jgi:hypothetical protein
MPPNNQDWRYNIPKHKMKRKENQPRWGRGREVTHFNAAFLNRYVTTSKKKIKMKNVY